MWKTDIASPNRGALRKNLQKDSQPAASGKHFRESLQHQGFRVVSLSPETSHHFDVSFQSSLATSTWKRIIPIYSEDRRSIHWSSAVQKQDGAAVENDVHCRLCTLKGNAMKWTLSSSQFNSGQIPPDPHSFCATWRLSNKIFKWFTSHHFRAGFKDLTTEMVMISKYLRRLSYSKQRSLLGLVSVKRSNDNLTFPSIK